MDRIDAEWLSRSETQAVCAVLTSAGARAFFVGGCVRNALIGAPVSDIDIATDARPERAMELARAGGLKAVPTGIDHGTVTVVSGGIPHEVTTFRRDVETDGRHAVVAFGTDIAEDAARRDFTMNALYAAPDGTLVDPLGGLPDLAARRVRFIGRAGDRIAEDHLRSLRFFRFHAWYGDPAQGFDPDALAAIATALDGLDGLSRERVGGEMMKLMAAPDPAPSVSVMERTGVLNRVLPGAAAKGVGPLVHFEQELGICPNSRRRLAALGGTNIMDALRLSRADAAQISLLRDLVGSADGPAALGYRHGAETARDALLLRAALLESPVTRSDLNAAERGAAQVFPVKPADLMPAHSGPELGARLAELTEIWIASGFTLDREALLAQPEG
jgi:poly(A) polymerase